MTRRRPSPVCRPRRGLCAFAADQAGSTAVVVAVLMPLVIAGLGLGAETGYWFMMQRKLQHIADVSAHAGAVQRRASGDAADIAAAVSQVAMASGLPDTATPTVTTPYGGNDLAVEVTLSAALPRFFTGIYSSEPVALRARAVAMVEPDPPDACVVAMSPAVAGALTVDGITSVADCDVVSGSDAAGSIMLNAPLTIDRGCAYAVGDMVGTHHLSVTDADCPELLPSSPPPDPYAELPDPGCGSEVDGLTIRCFSGPVELTASTLDPDTIYRVTGPLTVSPTVSSLSATNVSFYFTTNAFIDVPSAVQFNLTAPETGRYAGVLFAGRQAAHVINRVTLAYGSNLSGALYFPESRLDFAGASVASCTRLLAARIHFTGAAAVGCPLPPFLGEDEDLTDRRVMLIE